MKKSYFNIIVIPIFLILTNCSKDSEVKIPPPRIEDSFKTKSTSTLQLKDVVQTLLISKASLEKEFLIQSSMIVQIPAPTSSGLRSRVVFFKKKNDKIFMQESVQGQLVTQDLPADIILTEFPILSETETDIEFDFSKGMSQLFIASEWQGHDSNEDPRESQFTAFSISYSFIKEAKILNSNQLLLNQVSQVSANMMGVLVNVPVEVRYYLSPYFSNPEFNKKEAPKSFDRMGFFETMPLFDDHGNSLIYTTKFDEKKPVRFSVSANTPKEYQDAVRDGVLYWNTVYGKELVQVDIAPEGRTAPDIEYNIIQWVPWDQAGFAYADAQVDPRSGEILHAQIYMTSVFGFVGKNRARKLLRNLQKKSDSKSLKISLRGFEPQALCNLNHKNSSLINSLEGLIQSNASDELVLKASQDYVREVVAHEVGHTLGLRHNFAGNLEATYSLKQREDLVKNYFDGKKTPQSTSPSSSVMEYQVFEDSVLTGDLMSRNEYVGPYDKLAIQFLYEKSNETPLKTPLFCTDSHIEKNEFLDCQRFDIGRNLPEYVVYTKNKFIDSISSTLLEKFLNSLTTTFPNDKEPLETVEMPSLDELAKPLFEPRKAFLKSYSKKTSLIKNSREFYNYDFTNTEDIFNAKMLMIEEDIAKSGGLENILLNKIENIEESLNTSFKQLLDKNSQFIGYNGKEYLLSEDEKTIMLNRVSKYAKTLSIKLLEYDLKQLGMDYNFSDTRISYPLSSILSQLALKYTSARSENKLEITFSTKSKEAETKPTVAKTETSVIAKPESTSEGKSVTAKLSVFKYPFDIRIAASKLLTATNSEAFDWGVKERKSVNTALKSIIKEDLTVDPDQVDLERAPRDLRKWLFENNKVLESLN